eukprot:355280-Chlamydomonas_euryale.AAC.1
MVPLSPQTNNCGFSNGVANIPKSCPLQGTFCSHTKTRRGAPPAMPDPETLNSRRGAPPAKPPPRNPDMSRSTQNRPRPLCCAPSCRHPEGEVQLDDVRTVYFRQHVAFGLRRAMECRVCSVAKGRCWPMFRLAGQWPLTWLGFRDGGMEDIAHGNSGIRKKRESMDEEHASAVLPVTRILAHKMFCIALEWKSMWLSQGWDGQVNLAQIGTLVPDWWRPRLG